MNRELELRVTLADDERTLGFELSSSLPELRYYRSDVGSTRLGATPRQFLEQTFNELSQLARRVGSQRAAGEGSEVVERLAGIGQGLYRDLLPEPLKLAYAKLRALTRPEPLTLLITSDEPWIPWEIIKPYDEAGQWNDPFWCEAFCLTRWLRGSVPRQALNVQALALVLPSSNLAYAQTEADYFAQLAQRTSAATLLPPLKTAREVKAGLRNGTAQLWHFACHGSFAAATPDRSPITLEGGELHPEDIVGEVEWGVRKTQPLVLLNACHTGQQGFALTGLGGWARRLLQAGASAFVGAQWEAHDALAAQFATTFYDALWAGAPLGIAAHRARIAIRAQDLSNPTWLCYAVYGDPGLRVTLGPQPVVVPAEGTASPAQNSAVVMPPALPQPPAPAPTRNPSVPADLSGRLKQLETKLNALVYRGVLDEMTGEDARYQFKKAALQAAKPHEDRAQLHNHLTTARALLAHTPSAREVVSGIDELITVLSLA